MSYRACAALLGAVLVSGVAAPAAFASAPGTVQVTGTRLASALLPASDFGTGYLSILEQNSGPALVPGYPNAGSLSCALYSILLGDSYVPGGPGPGFGATAHATYLAWGNRRTHRSYRQAVYQFASAGAAASLYGRAYARFSGCRLFTLSGVGFTLRSESKTQVDGLQTFQATGTIMYPGASAYDTDTLFSTDGRDVFVLNAVARPGSSRASATPAAFLARLIARVQALKGS